MTDTKKEIIDIVSDLDYYGASHVLSDYCGLKIPLCSYKQISWQHGWMPRHFNIHPHLIVPGDNCDDLDQVYMVARNDHKDFLEKNGYKNVLAVGLPVVYLKNVSVKRKPNSLLVMPVHSLEYTNHQHWNFDKYAEQINKLKNDFDDITICLHPSCIKKGYWVKEFEQYGFKILEGSKVDDKNALYRMQSMMSSFEYMTTNGFGSHIVYASYFGAKVSLYGTFAEFKKDDFAEDPFYTSFPEALDPTMNAISEKVLREKFTDLFVFPTQATDKVSWAKKELGHDNKLSAASMRRLLNWDAKSRLIRKVKENLIFLKPVALKLKPR